MPAELILPPDDEFELICRAKGGDHGAIESLLKAHAGTVFRFVRSFLGDEHHAEDVAQQVWINVLRQLTQYDPAKASFLTWTLRIARNLSLNHLRDCGRSPIRFGTPIPAAACLPEPAIDSIQREQFADLDAALAKLPPHQRSAWTLFEIEGLSQAQVAAVEGIPEGTVKSRVSRAKKTLQSLLTQPHHRRT